MPLEPVNYSRMKRIQMADTPPPSPWEMNNVTKIYVAILFIGLLVLYRRWVLKKNPTHPLIDERAQFL